jgi:polysaccharide deacetylase family protein (PEP-CTERM system associated)
MFNFLGRGSVHGPARPRGAAGQHSIANAMTVDVEDYFHVSGFEHVVARARWDSYESRVVRNTERLLQLFADADVRATFFVLGWVAERFPSLIRRIAAERHEIASHGHSHRLIYEQSPAEFREDVRRAKAELECAIGASVAGYRAPSFSVTRASMWALDVLAEEGHTYDASIYPIRHDRYGIHDASRQIHWIARGPLGIWELPGSTVRRGGINWPIGGGGYFRQLPYGLTRAAFRYLNHVEQQPAIFYIHPWEIDPLQPRLNASVVSRLRHYRNLDVAEARLVQLLRDFQFAPAIDVLHEAAAGAFSGGVVLNAEAPALAPS